VFLRRYSLTLWLRLIYVICVHICFAVSVVTARGLVSPVKLFCRVYLLSCNVYRKFFDTVILPSRRAVGM